ncbi:shikimate kinase [Macrococcus hajekii]|uniref:Shikimate kinase n=2 Tax=Macrococcus hajekii TaxID=198482 RepID=A0A4R6BPF3_9STAP|nr:shikimate kinase [Macrococcus hajekii]
MGAGKTTLGQALAEQLNIKLIDLDGYIENKEGRTIREIFKEEGEEKFRTLETTALRHWLDENVIIATGGGIVEKEQNIHSLKKNKYNIWLNPSFDEMYKRVSNDSSRPNASGSSYLQIKELYNSRYSRYNEIAFIQVDTSHSIAVCLGEIISAIYPD